MTANRSKKERVVIIVPTYNERTNIQKLVPLVGNIVAAQKEKELLLLVVDDSSPDGTSEEVERLQKKYGFVRLLVNKKKSGLGGAYLKGMAEAFGKYEADIVMQMDADLSHDPKKIPAFLRALDDGADMALGSRYVSGGSIPSNWGVHRKFLSVVGNWIISIVLTSRAVSDWTTGYRAIRREVYEKIHPELNSDRFSGYTFQIGFLHKALRNGFKVAEVPFHFVDRTVGESKLGTEYIVNTLRYIFRVRIEEIVTSHFFKFLMVGGLGFVVNLVAYRVFAMFKLGSMLATIPGFSTLPVVPSLLSDLGIAVILGAEVAILSNYILNNIWTFKDRKIKGFGAHVSKFLQFNLGSVGSVVIQYVTVQTALHLFGLFTVLTLAGRAIESDNFYLAAGVLIGLIWNFTIYNLVIWKK